MRALLALALPVALCACGGTLRPQTCAAYDLARPTAVTACQRACEEIPERCPWREDDGAPEPAPSAPPTPPSVEENPAGVQTNGPTGDPSDA